jgi:hypothetical protein
MGFTALLVKAIGDDSSGRLVDATKDVEVVGVGSQSVARLPCDMGVMQL